MPPRSSSPAAEGAQATLDRLMREAKMMRSNVQEAQEYWDDVLGTQNMSFYEGTNRYAKELLAELDAIPQTGLTDAQKALWKEVHKRLDDLSSVSYWSADSYWMG